jgi:hypothetical protein
MLVAVRASQIESRDFVAAALCAAELNEPFDLAHAPTIAFVELFFAVQHLRNVVPYATFRLLTRLSSDERDELRVGVARALGHFVNIYPEKMEDLLLPLACDPARRVRAAAVEALSLLLLDSPHPEEIVERWRWYPDRAVDVLERARKSLNKRA